MNREEEFSKVVDIIKDVFDNDDLEISNDTVAKDVEGWDSINHLQLINEIEDEFDITFSMGVVQGFSNVGELVDYISKKDE